MLFYKSLLGFNWILPPVNYKWVEFLSNNLKISKYLAAILFRKGFRKPSHIFNFLYSNNTLNKLMSFDIINRATNSFYTYYLSSKNKHKLKILIYTDYDTDGLVSAYMLYYFFTYFLKLDKNNIIIKSPKKFQHGYGFSKDLVSDINLEGYVVFICDSYINQNLIEDLFYEFKVSFITILDHHLTTTKEHYNSIKTNKLHICNSLDFNTKLSSAGVVLAYLLSLASCFGFETKALMNTLIQYACFSTIADMVDMTDPLNKAILKKGLQVLNDGTLIDSNFKLLAQKCSINYFSYSTISWILAPKLNAPGRLDNPNLVISYFLCKDKDLKLKYLNDILNENKKRYTLQQEAIKDIEAKIANNEIDLSKPFILLYSDVWHQGVLGIISNKISRRFKRIAFVISNSLNPLIKRGSVRSPFDNLNIYNTLIQFKDLFITFGGHKQACGFEIHRDNISKLDYILTNVFSFNNNLNLCLTNNIDTILPFSIINYNLVNQFKLLDPLYDRLNILSEEVIICSVKKLICSDFNNKSYRVFFRSLNNKYIYNALIYEDLANKLNNLINQKVRFIYKPFFSVFFDKLTLDFIVKDVVN